MQKRSGRQMASWFWTSSWLFFFLRVPRQWRSRHRLQPTEKIMRPSSLTSCLAIGILVLQTPLLLAAEKKDAGKALNEFFEAEWNYEMEQSPVRASFMGDRRWNDRWGDQSLEAIRKREEHEKDTLVGLKKIDRAQLSSADQLNYDLFQKDLETDIEGAKFRSYLMPITQCGGIQTLDELTDRLRFETLKDFEDWVARLRAFPTLMDQNIALMREGASAH